MSDLSRVAWAAQPPSVPNATIYRPKETPVWIVALGPPVGVWVHWMGKRSLPCLGDQCPAARHRRPVHWTGYLPAALPKGPGAPADAPEFTSIVVPLSDRNDEDLRAALAAGRPCLQIVGRKNGKGWDLLKSKAVKRGACPLNAFDVRLVLMRAWGIRPDQAADRADAGDAPPPCVASDTSKPPLRLASGGDASA